MNGKAIILDYIGTLVEPRSYNLEKSRQKLFLALHDAGLEIDITEFVDAYKAAHERYRRIRYEQFVEVTNAVWVSEALGNAGCNVNVNDMRLKSGLNVFFQNFIDSLQLRFHAKNFLRMTAGNGKVGLISNFTYTPAIYASLRKLGINSYFNAVVISDSVGWQKPHRKIFDAALRILQVRANETVHLGDSPTEDIRGANAVGLKTVFVPSKFYSISDLVRCGEKPDVIVEDLDDACRNFQTFVNFQNTKPAP